MLARWEAMGLESGCGRGRTGREPSSCTTARPTRTATSISAQALNKILKDVVNRAQQMGGKDAHYVPGWDCHGLPIEWKIEEQYRAAKKDKDAVPVLDFRARMPRLSPQHWIGVQESEFRRLGVLGDWANRYATMDLPSEAAIVGEIGRFLMNGGAVSRAAAGDVVGRREDGAGRGRDRVSRPYPHHDHGALPDRGVPVAGAGGCVDPDLDDDAVDHAGQPGDRAGRGHRLRVVRIDSAEGGLAGGGRRAGAGGAGAAAAVLRGGGGGDAPCAASAQGAGAAGHGVRAPDARARLRP